MVELVCVDPKTVHQVWPQAKELIRSAIERTKLSAFSDIEYDVLSGDQLLWLAVSDRIEAAATTHLVQGSPKPILIVTAVAGLKRERWLSFRQEIEAYAKAEGCSRVRLYGRRGWKRALPDYHVAHVIMEKRL